ncbi:MAG: hypothetical protein ACOX87_08260 [Chloroflexota bacterium]
MKDQKTMSVMKRLGMTLMGVVAVTAVFSSVAFAQETPEFKLGFKLLADQIPDVVGEPLENEHWGANGDSLQQTSKGLMVWRKADNWTAFTNGSWTWINGPYGVQDRSNDERFDWEGDTNEPSEPSGEGEDPGGPNASAEPGAVDNGITIAPLLLWNGTVTLTEEFSVNGEFTEEMGGGTGTHSLNTHQTINVEIEVKNSKATGKMKIEGMKSQRDRIEAPDDCNTIAITTSDANWSGSGSGAAEVFVSALDGDRYAIEINSPQITVPMKGSTRVTVNSACNDPLDHTESSDEQEPFDGPSERVESDSVPIVSLVDGDRITQLVGSTTKTYPIKYPLGTGEVESVRKVTIKWDLRNKRSPES